MLLNLPVELIIEISYLLAGKDIFNLVLTNKKLCNILLYIYKIKLKERKEFLNTILKRINLFIYDYQSYCKVISGHQNKTLTHESYFMIIDSQSYYDRELFDNCVIFYITTHNYMKTESFRLKIEDNKDLDLKHFYDCLHQPIKYYTTLNTNNCKYLIRFTLNINILFMNVIKSMLTFYNLVCFNYNTKLYNKFSEMRNKIEKNFENISATLKIIGEIFTSYRITKKFTIPNNQESRNILNNIAHINNKLKSFKGKGINIDTVFDIDILYKSTW